MAIQALESKNLLEMLAEPNLLTINNTAAHFVAGGEFPYPVVQSSANGVNNVTILFREFGIRLNFTPTITPRGTIHYETKSFLTYFNGDFKPRTLTTGQVVVYGDGFDSQKAYTRSDISLRYTAPNDRFSVEAFVQNVEDAKIRTSASTFGPTRYDPVFLSVYQSPRTFGGRVRAAF